MTQSEGNDFESSASGSFNRGALISQAKKFGHDDKSFMRYAEGNRYKTGEFKDRYNFMNSPISNELSQDQVASGPVYSLATMSPVPEPEIFVQLISGLGLMGLIARRRKKA
jgi:PEP-CTERM motif